MSATPTSASRLHHVDLDDIQGLVRFGYKRHTDACFLLLRVRDRVAARAWLAHALVASAVTIEPLPATALQVALTSEGLRALGVPDDVLAGFSQDFVMGMGTDPNRARRLGDTGANAPARWRWGTGAQVPHVLLMLYALPGQLAAWQRSIEAQIKAGFDTLASLPTANLGGVEPFGFADGLSQPQLDWERQRPARDQEQPAYGNLSCLGEYLLGYPNEYGTYTDRPLIDPHRNAQNLPRAEDAPDRADLGRNGSYLVMRQLQQDVHGFWQQLDRQAGGDAAQRTRLAEAMVGRTLKGQPLVELDKPGDPNAFTYQGDPDGLRCPLGAHIRRSNPRNADLPPGRAGRTGHTGQGGIVSWLTRTLGFDAEALEHDRVASTRFHRLLRRGREYGPAVPLTAALSGRGDGTEVGLHFMCLGANIARQFEFVQGAWLAGLHFDGLRNESDPLLGSRTPAVDGTATDAFSMAQADGPDQRLSGLPPFVTVRGGAYFFLPGLRALRWLATAS